MNKSYADKLDGNLPFGMTDDGWNELMGQWASELNKLEIKLEERSQKSKILYSRLSLIMAFCNRLPELFGTALPEVKREIIQTCVRTLSYDGKNLAIELFPIFYELKNRKKQTNGAGNGLLSEPLRLLYDITTSTEYQYVEDCLLKFVA